MNILFHKTDPYEEFPTGEHEAEHTRLARNKGRLKEQRKEERFDEQSIMNQNALHANNGTSKPMGANVSQLKLTWVLGGGLGGFTAVMFGRKV